jgi:GNAT superfamily N-acetyltransferase
MDVIIKEVREDQLIEYNKIPMWFTVKSKYELRKINSGLGGIILEDIEIDNYVKDYSMFDKPLEWGEKFDLSNWGFFIAYDDGEPIAGATLAYDTNGVNMLCNRKDMSVLWDIRVAPEFKSKGVGSLLFSKAIEWSKKRNCKQIKIETQNINVPACQFYAKQGAKLSEINEYAYYSDGLDEVMLIWYYDLV